MKLFDYQAQAANELVNHLSDKIGIYTMLEAKGRPPKTATVHFISPTGSGKTVTAFAVMDELTKEYDNIVFIWIAPNTLHVQSKEKFEKYSEDLVSNLNPIDSDNIESDNILRANDILCLNWSSVDKDTNSLIKSGEGGKYIDNIIALTKENGGMIIAMIDESHIASQNEKTKANDFIQKLKPVARVDITATPKSKEEGDSIVFVERQVVIDSGVIKKEFIFNDFDDQEIDKEKLTRLAYKRLEEIKLAYDKETGGKVNPLMIIQIENDNNEEFRKVQFEIESYLEKIGIQKELIAYYLSEDKTNSDHLAVNNNPKQIVFTKTAIATGWDCPRASVLLTFRKSNNDKFKTQILGRINRMPELKHYGVELLDTAYVFANVEKYIPDNLDNQNVKTRKEKEETRVEIKDEYSDSLTLPIFTKDNVVSEFKDTKYNISKDIESIIDEFLTLVNDFSTPNITNRIIQKLKVSDITEAILSENNAEYVLKNNEIQDIFYSILKGNGFSVSQSGKVQGKLFEDNDDLDVFDGDILIKILKEKAIDKTENDSLSYLDVFKIIFNGDNNILFAETIKKIVDTAQRKRFSRVHKDRIFEDLDISYQWMPPKWFVCNQGSVTNLTNKNIYQSDCIKGNKEKLEGLNEDEIAFVCFLEKNDAVEYWYRNGSKGSEFFRIPYKKDNKIREFFPDFIVKYTDGTIGIYDTKSEMTAGDGEAKEKAEYLYKYREKFDFRFKGGLIKLVPLSGSIKKFIINDKEDYSNYDPNNVQWTDFGRIDTKKDCDKLI